MHTYTDTDSALITSGSTASEHRKRSRKTSPTPDIITYGHGPTGGSAITVLRTIKEIRKRILQSWTVTVRQLAKYLNTNKSTKSEPPQQIKLHEAKLR